MSLRLDAVCLGETMGQFVPTDGLGVQDSVAFALHQAGAESNVAIGLSRLGHRVAFSSRVGDDAIGRRVTAAIATSGVDTSLVRVMRDRRTGVFVKDPGGGSSVVAYYRSGSAASCLNRDDVDAALHRSPRLVHLSGITPALSASCDDAVGYAIDRAKGIGATVSFDVNHRPALWPGANAARRLQELADASDVCFVGLDEAEELWGIQDPNELRALLPGPRALVVKDGPRRAIAFEASGPVVVPALRVEVVEVVGAGDAFAAGFLSAFLRGRGAGDSLRSGHLLARAALLSLSDQGEAPTPSELAASIDDGSLWGIQ
ncbi:sugar kinase [Diaminobutyricibacter sp. McL0608]|uniref:sugar kinase n=1 Tax=Leifsonia sp. McL0608 TaxID=3143537 RepID=UPI0031F31EC4